MSIILPDFFPLGTVLLGLRSFLTAQRPHSLCSWLENPQSPSHVGLTLASKSQAQPGLGQTPGISKSVSLTCLPSTGSLAIPFLSRVAAAACEETGWPFLPVTTSLSPGTQCKLPQPFLTMCQ